MEDFKDYREKREYLLIDYAIEIIKRYEDKGILGKRRKYNADTFSDSVYLLRQLPDINQNDIDIIVAARVWLDMDVTDLTAKEEWPTLEQLIYDNPDGYKGWLKG